MPTEMKELLPEELERWLAAATKGLAPEAATDVRGEYESHFSMALEERLNGGENHDAAVKAVLCSMGPPGQIRKQVTRQHLTLRDLWWIKFLNSHPEPGIIIQKHAGWELLSYALLACTFIFSYLTGIVGTVPLIIQILGLIILSGGSLFVRAGKENRTRSLRAMGICMTGMAFLWAGLWIAVPPSKRMTMDSYKLPVFIVLVMLWLLLMVRIALLLEKLRKVDSTLKREQM